MPEKRSAKHKGKIPSTTVIGSYPIFIADELVKQFKEFPDEVDDPVKTSIELAVRDFISAGIEYPSTGQTRDSFIRLFLDPERVEGIEINGSEITVTGKIKRNAPIRLDDVVSVLGATSPPAPVAARFSAAKPAVEVHAKSGDDAEPSTGEINVIGCTVEQASDLVDKFLDTAVLDGKLRVRIIHGYGSGALRRGLRAFLSGHPHVDRFADAEPDHGGQAVTVVELKS
ncbi:MAG: Smr/MutS family protein [Acidobacteria bacterium]|nr:Smr/MutS family protein [Acidobacteriota bacterium]